MASRQMQDFIAALGSPVSPAVPPDLAAMRAAVDARYLRLPPPPAVHVETAGFPVAGEWLRPARTAPRLVVLYLHGGGYVLGRPAHFRGLVAAYAEAGRCPFFTPGYRLAPEHPFPAALHDAVAAYRQLLAAGTEPGEIVVGGDSAGGGLAVALLLALAEAGLPQPRGAFLLSPWTDLTMSGVSMNAEPNEDPWASRMDFTWRAGLYLGGAAAASELASPLFGRLAGLPPLHIEVGTSDRLVDDARRLAARARAAGVDVRLQVTEGAVHCFPLHVPGAPESVAAIERVGRFLRQP
jgi:epsilon-lactone hydrolase